ncbi:hypothetical protein EV202_1276 [Bacteroides heparinolyticus]|uniref:Uncharacterized protein n=1 Tax=Prevotella heparinolytica TaxID=28113 RepID=A0A4R2LF20_9BACE|nr:hypothetical protein [Bacteroides heparinolyticus]TCO88123.1 hypothetical protein EV202_1276 [Bacteroides heparinolyticus]
MNKEVRNYTSIASPDGKEKIWISRPTRVGQLQCTCSFSLKGNLTFVDAIDALEYLSVEKVGQIDEEFSFFIVRPNIDPRKCALRLIDDLPELMNEHFNQ